MLWDVRLKVWDRKDYEAWYDLMARYSKAGFNHLLLGGLYYTPQDIDEYEAMRLAPPSAAGWPHFISRYVKLTVANVFLSGDDIPQAVIQSIINLSPLWPLDIDEYNAMRSELHPKAGIWREIMPEVLKGKDDLDNSSFPGAKFQLDEIAAMIKETPRRPLYEEILTLEAKDEEEGYEIGYAHLKKQGYDIEAVSSYEKYSFDVDVIKVAL